MTQMPTLQQLRYFLAATRHGSFSAAAAAEHIAQPSLSEQVRRLEVVLGVVLFTRTSRQLQLTEAGRLLVPYAERAVADVAELAEAVREMRTLSGGTVSFGTFSSAHHYLLIDLIRAARSRYPGVTIRVVGTNSSEVANAVRAGELEAGLVQLPIDDRGLSVSPPVLSDAVVYVSADPERVRTPVTIERLAAAPLLLSEARWAEHDPLRRSLAERAQHAGVTIRPLAEVELQTVAAELAAEGVGDALISLHVARSQGYTERLHWAPLDPPLTEHFAFVTRTNGALSPATRMFVELARERLDALARSLPDHGASAQGLPSGCGRRSSVDRELLCRDRVAMDTTTPTRVAVIGAGAAGLETVRTLVAAGHDVVCFEREQRPGGHWHTDYDALHLITPRDQSRFDGFPMPAHYPLFPSRDQVRDYMLAFAEAHDLCRHIRFGVEVVEAAPTPTGWRIRTSDGEVSAFAALVVANGHLRDGRLPPYAAQFTGQSVHSSDYRNPGDIVGERVLVVGAGNSGCDLAVDAAGARKQTYLSMRSGQVFQPKTFFGRPRSELPLVGRLPAWAAERVARTLVRVSVGTSDAYPGLPTPATRNLNHQLPVVNSQLLYWIQHGRIAVLPAITGIDGTSVGFADGTSRTFDTILWATGFRTTLPFLDGGLLTWQRGVPLRVGALTVPLGPPRLYAVGLAAPRGAQFPVYSAQAQLVARMIGLQDVAPRPLAELLRAAGPPDDRIDILRPVWQRQLVASHGVLDRIAPARRAAA